MVCQVFLHVYYGQTMYNIKEAAARAGVSVPVLRAWERRYGIVHPGRSAGGYRQFDDAAVARIRAMRRLVENGWSPSAAAAAIVAGTAPLPEPEAPTTAIGERPDPGTPADATALGDRFVGAARQMDPDAVSRVLDEVFSRGSFESVATNYLFPALEKLGEAWANGEITVGAEHMASHAVHRRLAFALDAAGSGSDGRRRVVVGLPPGSRHELGALAFAIAARRAGIPVTYLGADLPADDWVAASAGAAAAVIGVVAPRDRGPAVEVARRLRAAHPALIVAMGGRAAQRTIGYRVLPDALADAVGVLSNAIQPSPALDTASAGPDTGSDVPDTGSDVP